MTVINWNDFEFLLGVAHGLDVKHDHPACEKKQGVLKDLLAKREHLDSQRQKFRNASEDEIINEYQKLRRAHREFMNSFEEAHQIYRSHLTATNLD